jgi:DNA (cytosine-5)-methyltransferase 1
MTRSGSAFALPTPEPRTVATASSSWPPGLAQPHGSRLLPTPVAGCFNDGESLQTWQARRDRQKKLGRNGNGIGTPLPVAIALLTAPMAGDSGADKAPGPVRPPGAERQTGLPDVIIRRLASPDRPAQVAELGAGRLLPTPDTGCSPNGHGRRGGRPGNGHQSGHGRDVTAIRRWEHLLGYPAPPPAEPGPSGRPRLSAAFAEWMMGIPKLVTGVPGIPRTRQLKLIGNGVVPQQAAAALRLLIEAAAAPAATGGMRAAA